MSANKISTIFFNIDIAPKAHDMGRNLLRGAGLTSLNSITEGGITFYRINSFSDSLVKIVDGVDGNKGVWVKTNGGETNVYRGVFFTAAVNKGETYTLSAWVKGTAGTTLYLEVLNSIGTARKNSDGTDGTHYTGTGSFATISDDWRRVTFTFTVDDLNGGYVECNFFTNAVGEFTISEPKLERGDVATAFCLNEADLKGDKGEKGDDGQNGKDGKNAVHYELRDNGSLADITIEDDKIKLAASLNYDLYRVDGTSETKTTGTVTNNLDGGSLSYSDAHYTKTITKEYTDIDSLPASVITTAKVNNTVVATAVCKVSMSKKGYFDANTQLGTLTSITTDNANNITQLQQDAERISAKVGGMANPNLLINSGFTMTSNGIPSYWEVWDDNKAQPAVTLNGDNCKVEVKATGMYQGIRQMRKMQLHSPLKLTFSCVAKGSGIMSVMLHKIQGSTQTGDRKDFNLKDGAQSLSCTFELSQYIDAWRVMIGFVSPSVGNNVTFYNPKLEIGEAATQWCENENDRVLATGIDIEKRKVTVTADKFKIIDNAGQDMMSVEKSGASSRVRLRNLMISGLTLREVVTLRTWSELRKYFSFDVQTLAGVTTATSTLNFQTCLNTFKLGNGCLVGREAGDTQDWNYQLNIVLPCKTYSASPTDADLAEMDNAMMYVGNRVILLNQSGRGISVFGRQEVVHMTTYLITSTNKGTVVSTSAKPSLAISKGTNLDKTDGRSYSTWNGSLTDTRGYYVPTIQSDGVTVKYKYTKYWTTDESWYVPNGWFAVMECVCDVDAEYAQDEYSGIEPTQGQSVFWKVKVGKMLTK